MRLQGGDFAKLTMPEMKAIAFVKFNGHVPKGDKAAHVSAMQKLAAAQPTILKLAATTTTDTTLALT